MAGDLDSLVEMGFDPERSRIALNKSGNLTSAIDWLDKNADKTIEQLKEEVQEAGDSSEPASQGPAPSFVCNDCGKKFRNMTEVQFHAEKSGHDDFGESTEEIAPLTAEEKKQRLEDLRARLAEKRAGKAAEDKAVQKRNEQIRAKSTREQQDAKEKLQREQQIKEAAKKRQEKLDDQEAKRKIKAKIEADKEARRRKAEEEKAMRENPDAYNPGAATASTTNPAAALAATTPKANHSEARLRLQTASGNVMKTFAADTTLFEVAHALAEENGTQVETFTQNFPKKVFDQSDFGQTLKEAGLVPSAALIVR